MQILSKRLQTQFFDFQFLRLPFFYFLILHIPTLFGRPRNSFPWMFRFPLQFRNVYVGEDQKWRNAEILAKETFMGWFFPHKPPHYHQFPFPRSFRLLQTLLFRNCSSLHSASNLWALLLTFHLPIERKVCSGSGYEITWERNWNRIVLVVISAIITVWLLSFSSVCFLFS